MEVGDENTWFTECLPLFYQEMFHSEKLRIRKDDVEKTRQYLKEREH